MSNILITGSGGLIGSEAALYYLQQGHAVYGIDNDMRSYFFGERGSTIKMTDKLKDFDNYTHFNSDIRHYAGLELLFRDLDHIDLVIHTAAQPSHDWAAKEPLVDFGVNALGTLHLLELTRLNYPEAVFIFTSTNKVYGDAPNRFSADELDTRYEMTMTDGSLFDGFSEKLTIDQSKHSVFGASKVAADIMVQEYGRYFDMKTACFRGGCLTGPCHSGVELHGFLSYLMKCIVHKKPYKVFGYKGKQVRDNIHSSDLVFAFDEFYQSPKCGEVYNIGGARYSNCSMLEAIKMGEEYSGNKLSYDYIDENRSGDHKWWISDTSKFESHYPSWFRRYNIQDIILEICREEMKN